MKVAKLIHVESEDWESLPAGKRSDIIRKFLSDYCNSMKFDLNGVNLELLKVKITTLENQKAQIDTELQSKKLQLSNAYKAQEEVRLKALEEEKKRIEDSKKCINCHNPIAENTKVYKFNKGNVCRNCFEMYAGQKLKEWGR